MDKSNFSDEFSKSLKIGIHFHYDFNQIRFDKRYRGIGGELRLSEREAKDLLFDKLNKEISWKYLGVIEEDPFTTVYVPRKEEVTNGIVSIFGDGKKCEEVCKFILSRERTFSPNFVTCIPREKYNFVEKILKEERGEDSRLNKGLLEYLFNGRKIIYD
jgi:hypothetical protein